MGGAWGADVCPQDIKLFVRGYNNGNNNSITINEKKDYDNRGYHHGNSLQSSVEVEVNIQEMINKTDNNLCSCPLRHSFNGFTS